MAQSSRHQVLTVLSKTIGFAAHDKAIYIAWSTAEVELTSVYIRDLKYEKMAYVYSE